MDITWHGHSCFRLRGRETTVVTDPYDRTTGYPTLKLTADVVTVSHDDPHHAHLAAVQGTARPPRHVDGPGEYEIAGAMIAGVRTYRDKEKGRTHGKNTAYLISIDDVNVCHLGDLGHSLTSEQLEALKDVDVLLVPVGGHCTIDAAEAAEVVSQLEPKLVVPMHYGTPNVPHDSIERFCREMAATDVSVAPKLSVTKTGMPDGPQVALLAAPEARR